MLIYIIRHGQAESVAADGSDAGRELTAEGREKLRAVLHRARGARMAPGLILTSPFVRAIQTAELAREVLGSGGSPERTNALTPMASPYDIWEELRVRRGEVQEVLLVSHQPLIGHLVAFLLDSPSLEVEVATATIAAVREESGGAEPRGRLVWMLTAELALGNPG